MSSYTVIGCISYHDKTGRQKLVYYVISEPDTHAPASADF